MVIITEEAYKKALEIVELAPNEITFFGFVIEKGVDLIINEIFLPKHQVCNPAHTNLLAEGYDELIDVEAELREKHGSGFFRCHFHSHVNMGVTPSGVDDNTLEEFLEDIPYFLTIIMNKKGEHHLRVGFMGMVNTETLHFYEEDKVRSNDFDFFKERVKEITDYSKESTNKNRPINYGYNQNWVQPSFIGIDNKYNTKPKKKNKRAKNVLDLADKEIEELITGARYD